MGIETAQLTTSGKGKISDSFREFLLLEKAQEAVRGRSNEQQAKIRTLAAAVDARVSAADSLSSWDQVPAALELLRHATVLAARGVLEVKGIESAELGSSAVFQEIVSLVDAGALPDLPPEFGRARMLLTDPNRLAFDQLPKAEAFERRADVDATIAWLRSLADPRDEAQIKMSRVLRLAAIAAVVLGCLAWAAIWGARKAFASKNVALGKPVTMSSRRPETPAGSGPAGLPPSGVVDGSIGSTYEVCTNYELNPWVMIDLESVRSIGKVKVYNRADCCAGSYDIPEVLELSDDGKTFSQVARRTTAFTAADPWIADVGGAKGRFVRIRGDSTESRELVLNEIEVFTK